MSLRRTLPNLDAVLTARANRVLAVAAEMADKRGASSIGTDDIARALLGEEEGPHTLLIKPRLKVKL